MCPPSMHWRAIASTVSTVLFLACASRPQASGTPDPAGLPPRVLGPQPQNDRPAPTSSASAAASIAPASSASPAAPSSPPGEPAIACAAACKSGKACALTNRGPACVECAPGSLPTCKGDRFVTVCGDDGSPQTSSDCFGQRKRCVGSTCQSRECTPNALHCFEGNVHRCNAMGTGRALVTACQTADDSGVLTLDKGVCQVRRGVPACHTDCFDPDATILALFGCSPCEPPPGDFCATKGTHACSDRICSQWPDGRSISGPWGAEGPCRRETDGLAVPGSDGRGACEGTAPIGARVISYEICREGHAVAATRTEPCRR